MKLNIDYEITEFTADDAADDKRTRQMVMHAWVACYVGILDAVERERSRIFDERIADTRRWARFMHYCHTGRMVE